MEFNLKTDDAYASLKIKDFRQFVIARFLLTFGVQMQSVIVGWQIYQLTKDALSLGLIGLAEALPFLAISLFGGHVADGVNRKKIIQISTVVYLFCAFVLYALSTSFHFILQREGMISIYTVIFITGLARGFLSPAQGAFFAQLIPKELFGNASTWSSLGWQIAAVTGPAVGGLIYGFYGASIAYLGVIIMCVLGFIFYSNISNIPIPVKKSKETVIKSLSEGLKFVYRNEIVLSAISLDMFAVFFGGAVAVLPIFADRILHIGAKGLGFLRAAPAVGAILMSVFQAYFPMFQKAGRNLIMCVFGFGIAIIIFALSQNFYLSLFLLLISGMFDNVSVVIRSTIIQLYTPDEMRGRVSAINGIFIGSSNELGSFESGVAAKLIGLVPSVIFGGGMTLVVVAAVRKASPLLKRLNLVSSRAI